MKVPEKIYLTSDENNSYVFTQKRSDNMGVEYIRTDAFIQKAKEAFCKATCNGHPPRSTCTSLGTCKIHDNFVKFMRGE